MALFQPSNITPSAFSGPGAGTIDVYNGINVSWQVNGNTPMIAYQIDIMQNTSDSALVYSTGKVLLEEPFSGVNYQGNTQYFKALISSDAVIQAGMYNGYEPGYKLSITQWWGETDFIAQSSASFFITRSAPVLTMEAIPAPIASRVYSFKADYSQEQGDPLEWVQWEIVAGGENQEILLDTGKIYGTTELQVDYDGLFPGSNYLIKCDIQTVNGVMATTGWIAFSAQYGTAQFEGQATACVLCNTDAAQVSFPPGLYIMGTPNGSYTLSGGEVQLNDHSFVEWDKANGQPMVLNAPYSIAWHGTITDIENPVALINATLENGTLSVFAQIDGVYAKLNEEELFSIETPLVNGDELTVILSPFSFFVYRVSIENATLPSQTLYPSAGLFPSSGQRAGYAYNASSVADWQTNILSISLNGPQIADYLWIVNGEFAQNQISQMMSMSGYSPTFDNETQFLADFSSGFSAGSLSSSEEVTGISVYRLKEGDPSFYHIADFPIGTQSFRDYGVSSQGNYQYYIYAATKTAYATTSLVTGQISPVFWNYTLMACTEDENGVYHVQNEYRFALDISSGVVGNNNEPSIHKNFTRYPTRQATSSNYRSGTLSAYIGKAENGKYIDSVQLMEDLYALSTSTMMKFLKNRKGELIRVETSAPITMQLGDKYAAQPAKISLPWIETGSANNVSIVTDPNDPFWDLE